MPQISVKGETYDRLKAASDLTQKPVSKIVDRLINEFLDKEGPAVCSQCKKSDQVEQWGESGEFWWHCHRCDRDDCDQGEF